ncbi:MAG TPA: hypothetical protein VLG25_02175 [Patescibacteria group bacterium]|nr:hypothetical protein [Patescibacteria group bacterium]
MLSNGLVGLMLGAGVAAWVYGQVQHRTGNNTQNSLIVAGIAGLFTFLIVVTAIGIIF